MDWVTTYLGLGANIGDPPQMMETMRLAARMLEEDGDARVVEASSFYRTKPWGVKDQPDFVNAVLKCETHLAPTDLLKLIKKIEQQLGRKTTYRWGPRVLDIDILLYGNQAISAPELTIPHPGLLERTFVIVPLLEIESDVILPSGEPLKKKIGAEFNSADVERIGPFCQE